MSPTAARRAAHPLLALVLLAGCPALGPGALSDRLDLDGDEFESDKLGGTDCDDLDPNVNPKAKEVCDGVDNDCDDLVNTDDPSLENADWWLDADQDGFGRADVHQRTCADLGASLGDHGIQAWTHDADDCDDTDPAQHPGAAWDIDGDGDGWGVFVEARRLVQCLRPPGYVEALGDGDEPDCDDVDADRNPGEDEICDAEDNDCDDVLDEDPIDGRLLHVDADQDGYGVDDAQSLCVEDLPLGMSMVGGDCDDDDPARHPGVDENWGDDIDQDCDGNALDQDGDGQDRAADGGTDCDDLNADVFQGAPEICDGVRNDCDPGGPAKDSVDGVWFKRPGSVMTASQPAIDWTGTLSSDGDVLITQAGTLWFCGPGPAGGGPWTGRVEMRDQVDLTVEGVRNPVLDAGGRGANLLINPAVSIGTATLRGMTFRNGAQGCVDIYVSSIVVEHCLFSGCSTAVDAASGDGGGAHLRAVDTIVIRDSSFQDNTARLGGGARVEAPDILIEDSTFASNVATVSGGGLSLGSRPEGQPTVGTAVLNGVTLSGNDATVSPGPTDGAADGLATENLSVTLDHCTLDANDAVGWRAIGGSHAIVASAIQDHGTTGVWLTLANTDATATCGPVPGHATTIVGNAVGVTLDRGTFVAQQGCTMSNDVDVLLTKDSSEWDVGLSGDTTCVWNAVCQ